MEMLEDYMYLRFTYVLGGGSVLLNRMPTREETRHFANLFLQSQWHSSIGILRSFLVVAGDTIHIKIELHPQHTREAAITLLDTLPRNVRLVWHNTTLVLRFKDVLL